MIFYPIGTGSNFQPVPMWLDKKKVVRGSRTRGVGHRMVWATTELVAVYSLMGGNTLKIQKFQFPKAPVLVYQPVS